MYFPKLTKTLNFDKVQKGVVKKKAMTKYVPRLKKNLKMVSRRKITAWKRKTINQLKLNVSKIVFAMLPSIYLYLPSYKMDIYAIK